MSDDELHTNTSAYTWNHSRSGRHPKKNEQNAVSTYSYYVKLVLGIGVLLFYAIGLPSRKTSAIRAKPKRMSEHNVFFIWQTDGKLSMVLGAIIILEPNSF